MPPDENEIPEPQFPDPGRHETRQEPLGQPPPAPRTPYLRGLVVLLLGLLLLLLLILLALDGLGIIDIFGR